MKQLVLCHNCYSKPVKLVCKQGLQFHIENVMVQSKGKHPQMSNKQPDNTSITSITIIMVSCNTSYTS